MWDDFNDDNDWENEDGFDPESEKDQTYSHPLMKKCQYIVSLTHALVGSLDEARKELYGGIMMEGAMILGAKFAGAESVEDYILKMENATLMKIHARSLRTMTYQLALEETHAEEHLQLLREAIDDFKLLFVDWVQTFDSNDRLDDGWGLFI
jgi:hypothetical protein